MTAERVAMKPLKTWSHLAKNRRRPTEYEVVSTELLWTRQDPDAPFTLSSGIPMSQWFIKFRENTQLTHTDWDAFRDPDQLVYRTYNTIQDGQEAYVDGLLDEHARNDHDFGLSDEWLTQLAARYTPGRYLIHALQMSSNYLVALAPSSTVANCLMFQAGDQLRWVSRIAYRTAELRRSHPGVGFGETERGQWEASAHWRGFVELIEKMLVTWDFAEQLIVLNVIAKPAIDAAYLRQFGNCGRRHGDALIGLLADAQCIDSERSKRWTRALVQFVLDDDTIAAQNLERMRAWVTTWVPLADNAIDQFFDGLPESHMYAQAAKDETRLFRQGLGLT